LKADERPKIDPDFEEVTEGEEVEKKEKLKTKWARLEAMVGTDNRIEMVAKDLIDHVEKRFDAMEGKAMIVEGSLWQGNPPFCLAMDSHGR
jgi:type I restriction enzyme R subunit